MGEQSTSTKQRNEAAAVNKEPAMKSLGKTFSLDSGSSLLTVRINCFSYREIDHCIHPGQENHPLQQSFQTKPSIQSCRTACSCGWQWQEVALKQNRTKNQVKLPSGFCIAPEKLTVKVHSSLGSLTESLRPGTLSRSNGTRWISVHLFHTRPHICTAVHLCRMWALSEGLSTFTSPFFSGNPMPKWESWKYIRSGERKCMNQITLQKKGGFLYKKSHRRVFFLLVVFYFFFFPGACLHYKWKSLSHNQMWTRRTWHPRRRACLDSPSAA